MAEVEGDQGQRSRKALYWDLVSSEALDDAVDRGDIEGGGADGVACRVVAVEGDILVFECVGRRSILRRFDVARQCWRQQDMQVVVHAAVQSPVDPQVVILLHCPSEWNSDHRYEVYAFHADTGDLEPLWVSSSKSQQLVDAGVAPKKRHGFSIAPVGVGPWGAARIYFFCGLQHFPGDATGSFVYCFSLDTCVWTEVEYSGVFPAPYPECPYRGCRFGQSCAVHASKAWLFGGCVNRGNRGVSPTHDLFTFDLEQYAWEKIEPQGNVAFRPPKMSGHIALASLGRMLVFGGDDVSQDIYSFNMATTRWEMLPPVMLGPRPADGRVVCCLSGDRLIAYQQFLDEAPGESLQNECTWKHQLFALSCAELEEAILARTHVKRQRRKRQELDLLGDEATADVAFNVEGHSMVAHRAILQRFAPKLARGFDPSSPTGSALTSPVGSFVESPTPKSPHGIVRIEDVTAKAFYLLLEHIYSRFTKPLTPADADVLLELAHRFELGALLQQCQDVVVVDASNVRHFLTLCVGPTFEVLHQKCIAYLTSHPDNFAFLNSLPAGRHHGQQVQPSAASGPSNITSPEAPLASTRRTSPELPAAMPRTSDAFVGATDAAAHFAAAAAGWGDRAQGPHGNSSTKASAAAVAAAVGLPAGAMAGPLHVRSADSFLGSGSFSIPTHAVANMAGMAGVAGRAGYQDLGRWCGSPAVAHGGRHHQHHQHPQAQPHPPLQQQQQHHHHHHAHYQQHSHQPQRQQPSAQQHPPPPPLATGGAAAGGNALQGNVGWSSALGHYSSGLPHQMLQAPPYRPPSYYIAAPHQQQQQQQQHRAAPAPKTAAAPK